MIPDQACSLFRSLGLLMGLLVAGGFADLSAAHAQEHNLYGIADVPFPISAPVYRQPVSRNAYIIQGNFGSFSHNAPNSFYAWDYDVPVGTNVLAARSGVVVRIWNHSNIGGGDKDRFIEYGNYIIVDHLDGTFAQYYHLAKDSFGVQSGDYVLQGEPIAASGDTGYLLGPHLHFAVFDKDSNECIPIRFCDFKKNNGVPAEGDVVEAAQAPRTPLEVIRSSKKSLRASLHAESLGCLDLAWLYARDAKKSRRHSHYIYIKVLEARASMLHDKLKQRIEALTGLDEPTMEDCAEAARYISTLPSSRDWNTKWLVYNLKKTVQTWQNESARQWQEQEHMLERWLHSIRLECEGDRRSAAFSYIEILSTAKGILRDKALTNLKNIISKIHADLKFETSLCAMEIKIATTEQLPRVRKYAEELWFRSRPLLLAWAVYFPADRKRARLAIEETRHLIEKITSPS